MENWNRFLLNEAAKTAEELPEHVYITIKGNKNLFHVTYTDINGKEKISPYGKIVCTGVDKEAPCGGAMQIGIAYAPSGWGPLLYDVAMEHASKIANGLTAGRISVSGAARSVWKYYMSKRQDVVPHQLDDVHNTLTNQDEDYCIQTSSRGRWGEQEYWEFSPLSKRYTKEPTVIQQLKKMGKLLYV